ncbi:hypothetical protein T09_9072 [Trichinella sp. T9]|nr:hypothetical protein T09_9072 [Trichinella sp. T9]
MSSGPMLQIQSRTQTLRLIVRVNLTQGALNGYYSVVFHCYDPRLSDNNFRHFQGLKSPGISRFSLFLCFDKIAFTNSSDVTKISDKGLCNTFIKLLEQSRILSNWRLNDQYEKVVRI